jgi:hypothetical protein
MLGPQGTKGMSAQHSSPFKIACGKHCSRSL